MSTFALKISALIFMTIDHIGLFLPNMPIYLRWIGRLALPLFIFCSVEGFVHTKNIKSYITRLYVFGILMSFVQWGFLLDINIFRLFFNLNIILIIIKAYKEKDENRKKYIYTYIIWQSASIIICIAMFYTNIAEWFGEEFIGYVLTAILGSIFYFDGGLCLLLVGVLFYIYRGNKKAISMSYIIYCIVLYFVSTTHILAEILGRMSFYGFSLISDILEYILDTIIMLSPMDCGGSPFNRNFQWMMVFALPIILLYNNKKGKSLKYFFYIYYPLHIIVLSLIGKSYT